MQFNTPQTIEKMYEILNDLFHYYRVERQPYEELELQSLKLARLTYTPKTDTQLATIAQDAVSSEYEIKKREYKDDIERQKKAFEEKILLAQVNAESEINDIISSFDKSIEKIQAQAVKAGFANTNVVVQQTAKLESDKNVEVAKVNAKKNQLIADYTAEITALDERLSTCNTHFFGIQSSATQTKYEQLKEERQKLSMEVFKYNNSLDEKEQRYENTLKQAKMRIKLNYMEISNMEISKDELIEMGYYQDVITCVCGYFDTLSPVSAYDTFKANKKLSIYLDDYYQSILYLYKVNANL